MFGIFWDSFLKVKDMFLDNGFLFLRKIFKVGWVSIFEVIYVFFGVLF